MVTRERLEAIIEEIMTTDADYEKKIRDLGLGDDAIEVVSGLAFEGARSDFEQMDSARSLAETIFTALMVGIEVGVTIEKEAGGEVAP